MSSIDYILCHGSGNRFVMIDGVERDVTPFMSGDFVQKVCRNCATDGVLFLLAHPSGHYEMRMFNTDGTQAEMCGNGIRCCARLAHDRYEPAAEFVMISGEQHYTIKDAGSLGDSLICSYSVDIPIATASDDFTLTTDRFVGKRIEALDTSLYFTYLNLGNPHIVAFCDEIDLDRLTALGERVKQLPMIFPRGVNVSLAKYMGSQRIFVATFERGVGLTASCGTAMTASATASVLLGVCRDEYMIDVRNRGGKVDCKVLLDPSIKTTLAGNATYIATGKLSPEGEVIEQQLVEYESEAWDEFVEILNS